jgi:hypothetical protein
VERELRRARQRCEAKAKVRGEADGVEFPSEALEGDEGYVWPSSSEKLRPNFRERGIGF